MLRRRVLINKNSTISSSSLSFVVSLNQQQQSTFFTSPTPILRARPEDEERARQWKLPSILTQFLDKTAPAHLRGTYIAEAKGVKQKEEELEKKKKEAEEIRAKKKSAATQAAKVSFTAEERGFVKGGARRSNQKASTDEKENNAAAAAEKKSSKDKYGVNWSNEEIDERATSSSASSSSSSTVSFGSNLPRSKQFVEETEEEATDFLAGTQKAKKEQQEAALNKGKKKKKEPGFFTRAWQTFHMSREDASAVRDEDADNNEAKGLRDDELQTGKYFKKLHKVSLKSWTKQCFQRLPDVEDCKLLNVEVELDEETDIVTVFVTADNLSDKQLTEVKKWVEGICPVSKARDKLLQRMEDEDRKRQSHVLASAGGGVNQFRGNRMTGSGSSRMVQDPLKQFAKRRNIRWIRIDPDL